MSKLGLFRGFSKVIALFIWLYSCWFCRICWLGIVVPNVSYMFLEIYVQAMACLTYVCQVACVACQLINSPFIVGRNVVVF